MNNVVSLGNAQRGFTRMDNQLYEALIGADLSGRELRVALAVHRFTAGYNVETARIPAATIAQMANLRREHVSRMISELIRQRVLYRAGGSKGPLGISPVSEWRIDQKNEDKKAQTKTAQSAISGTSLVPFPAHIKDRKDSNTPDGVVAAAAATPACQTDEPTPVIAAEKPAQQQERIPYAEIAALYNSICGHVLPRCKSLTDKRKAAIRSCWNLTFGGKKVFRDLEFWEGYFNDAAEHPFLSGQVKPWRADFDFLTRASAAVKILEGGYDN